MKFGFAKIPPVLPPSRYGNPFTQAWQQSRGSISMWVVWTCVALFLGVALLDLLHVASRSQSVTLLGLSYPGVFRNLWLHQFFTAPLLHGSVLHLVFNMLSLWLLGPGVERTLGRGRYIMMSAMCALSGLGGFLLFNWGGNSITLGYSAVIFGLLVAQAIYFPDMRIAVFAFFPLKMKHAVLLLAAVELYLTLTPEDTGIAHASHLFGALTAWGYISAVRRRKLRPKAVDIIGFPPQGLTPKMASRPAKRIPPPQAAKRPRASGPGNKDIPREL